MRDFHNNFVNNSIISYIRENFQISDFYEKFKAFIYAIISLVAGTIASILYEKNLVSAKVLLIILFGCILLLFMIQIIISIFRKRKKVDYVSFRSVLANNTTFEIEESHIDAIRNMIQKYGRIKCIYQIKVKHHINWIDAIYWGFLGALSEIGVDVTILLCDTEFYFDSKQNYIVTRPSSQYLADMKKMMAWIRKLSSRKTKIVLASEFCKGSSNDKNLVLLLYEVLFPYLINNTKLIKTNNKYSAIQTYRFLLGLCMMCSDSYTGPILAMTWEGRLPIIKSFISECNLDNNVYPLIGKTVKDDNGVPLVSDDTNKIDVEEQELYETLKQISPKYRYLIGKYVLKYTEDSTDDIDLESLCRDIIKLQNEIKVII